LEWPSKPGGLDIRYAVKTAKANAASGRLAPLGAFAGTRGRAMPIVGVNLELSGAQASALEFAAEAFFLGAPAMRMTGKRVQVSARPGASRSSVLKLGLQQVAKGEEMEMAAPADPADPERQSRARLPQPRAVRPVRRVSSLRRMPSPGPLLRTLKRRRRLAAGPSKGRERPFLAAVRRR